MIPQGSEVFNTQYFTNSINSVNACTSCDQLRGLATPLLASVAALEAGVTAELAVLTPMLALLTPPTNLSSLITWASTLVSSYLEPQLRPTVTYAAQITELTVSLAELTAAISSAAGKFPNCSI